MSNLANRNIVLIITGGVAAYKGLELLRLLKNQQAQVEVVLSQHATEFITPLAVQALNGHAPYLDEFKPHARDGMDHIALARFADCIIVAPATANMLAQIAQGSAQDLIGSLCLAATVPLFVAPAMNQAMWQAPATQDNIQRLLARNVKIMGPAQGVQACGDVGPGRLLEPEQIVATLAHHFSSTELAGKKVVITAGPTQEALDPIRYLSNYSSGKMGYALASAAYAKGAHVYLISGPVNLTAPNGVSCQSIVSAEEMRQAVAAEITDCDIFISAAAVADYRPVQPSLEKIKKQGEHMVLELTRTPDILAEVAAREHRPFCVGFAAETALFQERAKQKLIDKRLDLIIANQISAENPVFSCDDNTITLISRNESQTLPRASKRHLADSIMNKIIALL